MQTEAPHIPLFLDAEATKRSLEDYSKSDAAAYPDFVSDLTLAGETLRPFLLDPAAELESYAHELELRKPGLAQRFLLGSLRDAISFYFSNPTVQGACAATAALYPAPTSAPGTAFALPYLAQSCVEGSSGWGSVVGGIGTVANLLADTARSKGSRIHLSSPVRRIVVEDRAAVGVETSSGMVSGDVVLCAIDPHLACTQLIGSEILAEPCAEVLKKRKYDGGCAKLNLLLDLSLEKAARRWPIFRAFPSSLMAVCPSLNYIDSAYAEFASGHFASRPYLEIIVPSACDPSMACGAHTPASVFALFAPFTEMKRPQDREKSKAVIVSTLEEYFPGIGENICWYDYLGPREIAERFGMHRGNVDHGSMTLDNLFQRRPFTRCPDSYPGISRLFFSSAGRHPGGLVSGVPGYVAVREIMRELNARN